jgi:queuine tRNA-ribosyltransferase
MLADQVNSVHSEAFSFDIIAKEGSARAGIFRTPHGDLYTPIFAPVGTAATVKALTPAQLSEAGASLVLANTYHLYLRPGDDLVSEMGGLHQFMSWPNPILTDSGGFQVFSLSDSRLVDEDGVTFKSHIDGSTHRITPEKSISIQENLGADIIMAFDECAPPYERSISERAMDRTHRWAERCQKAKRRQDQALFGIVQGGIFEDLRLESGRYISQLGFPGCAIGGLSVGENKDEMHAVLDLLNGVLPPEKPRYLMGVGTPIDLVNGILRGIDIFDCVLPTRLARHNAAMTRTGRINMMNASLIHDPKPIDETCDCYTCQHFSRSYLRHLVISREMLAASLLSIHNIYTLLRLCREIREMIIAGSFSEFAIEYLASFQNSISPIDD